ncbi:calmodulin dependent protein kinase [Clohesyomyces aquaticus]|uniref:Calmodulin dependent protein kinase n=1 Tax=Clohesyomyces aquaticus TaxID=1231657 RepID=A0A1Y2A171_9PLEO|nr:calmodulin dependent protein kinase [Clohesyomyces aquaticus]
MAAPRPPTKHISDTSIPGIFSSDTVSLDVPAVGDGTRPSPVKFMSAPAYHSPLRHHKRAASSTRPVKETLNARSEYSNSEDDGTAQHRINQYLIKQEIGRGSFGAVHLAVDQYGQEYAVKEFSKSRLRKRAQSNLLRRPSARRRRQGALAAGLGFNSPLHRHSSSEAENNSLDLIKEEIAIMKKLNHPNVVSLIEVLDDPEEDSLYMVMEMCKKGVVMQVGLEERADPYGEEHCRCWFRDMILGIEYLHAQGIIHRDIKPDNCLVTDDDVLKIVDFGVSEMFGKESEMETAKSAGSPAFMPPELCVAKHGQVSGKAADIWSMGVTLYCLLFGRIPFEKTGMLELYHSIRNDKPEVDFESNEDLKDLLLRLLEKDPNKRIKMDELREHPWVTRRGTDPLLSTAENIAHIVEEPTDEEVNAAITGNMGHLVTVVRAVKRFKQLLFRKRPELMEGILGSASRIVQPPLSMRPSALRKSKSADVDDRRPIEGALTSEGIHREIKVDDNNKRFPNNVGEMAYVRPDLRPAAPLNGGDATHSSPSVPQNDGIMDAKVVHDNMSFRPAPPTSSSPIPIATPPAASVPATPIGKGHAHDPLEDTLFLNIGPGEDAQPASSDQHIVSESPSAVDINVYEAAYQEEIARILKRKEDLGPGGRRPTIYLTRRVENVREIRDNENIFDSGRAVGNELKGSLKAIVERAKKGVEERGEAKRVSEGREGLLSRGLRSAREIRDLVDEAREKVRAEEKEKERERSRSCTPVPGMEKEKEKEKVRSRMGSRTGTPRSGTPVSARESGEKLPLGGTGGSA